MTARHVLSANLKVLMSKRPELDTFKKITEASNNKLSNGKLDRIRRATHATDIDSIGELAEVFGVQPWQLLVPDMNPEVLPQIAGAELLESIRALVLAQSSHSVPVGSEPAQQSGKKKPLGRLPGEVIRTDRVKGTSGEVDKPGAIPRKRSR